MSTIFITRHPGAVEWLKANYPKIAKSATMVSHFDASTTEAGDVIVGILPVNMICDVINHGARFIALQIDLPAELRGKELTVEDMDNCNAKLQEYHVEAIDFAD